MKMLEVIIKELKQDLRNRKSMIFMVLFPIILIMVLGAALSSQFDSNTVIKDMKVAYKIQQGSVMGDSFKGFIVAMKKKDITFKECEDEKKAIDKVKENEYTCFVKIGMDALDLYKNDKYQIKAGMVEGILNNFVQKGSVYNALRINNHKIERNTAGKGEGDYVKIEALKGKKQPGSLDYYAITMLTLIIMYGAMNGAWAIKNERMKNTESRVLCAPISKLSYFIGKLLGTFVTVFLQISAVILFSKYVLNAYWGENMVDVLIVLSSLILFSLSMGICVALVVKNENLMSTIISSLIPFVAFFGGAYFPIKTKEGSFLEKIVELSPLHWTNKSLFKIIYDGSSSFMGNALAVNIGLAIAFILIASLFFRREQA